MRAHLLPRVNRRSALRARTGREAPRVPVNTHSGTLLAKASTGSRRKIQPPQAINANIPKLDVVRVLAIACEERRLCEAGEAAKLVRAAASGGETARHLA